MNSIRSGRRRFLEQGAALAGLALGRAAAASGQEAASEFRNPGPYGERSRFVTSGRTDDQQPRSQGQANFGRRKQTPLQDVTGIITPSPVHFIRSHTTLPDTDPKQYRLLIHGLVDRPLSFTLDDLKRLPSESRIHFLECQGNSSPDHRKSDFETVQGLHGGTSCSEWTGVPLSVLFSETGLKKEGSWLISESADGGKWTHSL